MASQEEAAQTFIRLLEEATSETLVLVDQFGGNLQFDVDRLLDGLTDFLLEIWDNFLSAFLNPLDFFENFLAGPKLLETLLTFVLSLGDSIDDLLDGIREIWLRAALEFAVEIAVMSLPKTANQRVLTHAQAIRWAGKTLAESTAKVLTLSPFEIVAAQAITTLIDWLKRLRLGWLGGLADLVNRTPVAIFIALGLRAIAVGSAIALVWVIAVFVIDGQETLLENDLPQPKDSDYRGRWPM